MISHVTTKSFLDTFHCLVYMLHVSVLKAKITLIA